MEREQFIIYLRTAKELEQIKRIQELIISRYLFGRVNSLSFRANTSSKQKRAFVPRWSFETDATLPKSYSAMVLGAFCLACLATIFACLLVYIVTRLGLITPSIPTILSDVVTASFLRSPLMFMLNLILCYSVRMNRADHDIQRILNTDAKTDFKSADGDFLLSHDIIELRACYFYTVSELSKLYGANILPEGFRALVPVALMLEYCESHPNATISETVAECRSIQEREKISFDITGFKYDMKELEKKHFALYEVLYAVTSWTNHICNTPKSGAGAELEVFPSDLGYYNKLILMRHAKLNRKCVGMQPNASHTLEHMPVVSEQSQSFA